MNIEQIKKAMEFKPEGFEIIIETIFQGSQYMVIQWVHDWCLYPLLLQRIIEAVNKEWQKTEKHAFTQNEWGIFLDENLNDGLNEYEYYYKDYPSIDNAKEAAIIKVLELMK